VHNVDDLLAQRAAWEIPAPPDPGVNESAPSAAYRQHHDVEAPRVDERHFRPAWRVLTRLDGLLADHVIPSAEWHVAADFRELVDQVRCRALTRSSAFGTVRASRKKLIPEQGRR
jgi:hypothetical protein